MKVSVWCQGPKGPEKLGEYGSLGAARRAWSTCAQGAVIAREGKLVEVRTGTTLATERLLRLAVEQSHRAARLLVAAQAAATRPTEPAPPEDDDEKDGGEEHGAEEEDDEDDEVLTAGDVARNTRALEGGPMPVTAPAVPQPAAATPAAVAAPEASTTDPEATAPTTTTPAPAEPVAEPVPQVSEVDPRGKLCARCKMRPRGEVRRGGLKSTPEGTEEWCAHCRKLHRERLGRTPEGAQEAARRAQSTALGLEELLVVVALPEELRRLQRLAQEAGGVDAIEALVRPTLDLLQARGVRP